MAAAFDIKDLERRMRGSLATLKTEFGGLRTGRASASLVEPLTVEAYGTMVPMTQVGAVSVPEPRTITIQVWDKALVSAVDRAIRESNLGLSPAIDGQLLRLRVPELNEERRRELTKIAAKYAEAARVAVRNVRRDGMEHLKKAEKDGSMSKDEHHSHGQKIQELTDKIIKEVDEALAVKETEIMQV